MGIYGVEHHKPKFRLYQFLHGFWRRYNYLFYLALIIVLITGIGCFLFAQAEGQVRAVVEGIHREAQ